MRLRTRLAILVASLAAGVVLLEIVLRHVLFAAGDPPAFAAELRRAHHFSDPLEGDDYWKLFLELDRVQPPLPERLYHPVLGWVSGDLDRTTLAHAHAGEVGARRPVLLFGDSFAQCMNGPRRCFQGLLESSDLSQDYCLLNYAVRGYGLDQMYLLLERAVEQWKERRPVVVIGFQLDESIDRVVLHLRGWPKPRFRCVDGALELDSSPVPSTRELLEKSPPKIRCYAWRYLVYGTHLFSDRFRYWYRNDEPLNDEKKLVARCILEKMQDLLESRGIPYFFLVFHGEHFLSGVRAPDWRERFLVRAMEERKIPYVCASHVLRDHARWYRHGVDRFFGRTGDVRDHYLPLTNTIAFEALHAGLERRFEPWGAATIPTDFAPPKSDAAARKTDGVDPDLWLDRDPDGETRPRVPGEPQDDDRLNVRARRGEPKIVRYALDGRCRELAGTAQRLIDAECAPSARTVRIAFELDAVRVGELELSDAKTDSSFDVDLAGGRELAVVVQSADPGAACALVGLTRMRSR